jgi:hypothetical protein
MTLTQQPALSVPVSEMLPPIRASIFRHCTSRSHNPSKSRAGCSLKNTLNNLLACAASS